MQQSCIICQSDDSRIKYLVDSFEIVQCKRCKLIYLRNPLPAFQDTETYDHYFKESARLTYEPDSASPVIRTLWAINKQRIDWIDRMKDVTSILDIGSGRGHFLHHASMRGYQVHGIEISRVAADYCQHIYGLTPSVLNIESADWHIDETYDVITMWHVLEHLADPITVLKTALAYLKPNGHLIIEVPNINSIKFRLARQQDKWIGGNHPRHHRFFFSHHTLRNLVEKSGFQKSEIQKQSYRIPDYSQLTNVMKKWFKLIHRDAFLTLIAGR